MNRRSFFGWLMSLPLFRRRTPPKRERELFLAPRVLTKRNPVASIGDAFQDGSVPVAIGTPLRRLESSCGARQREDCTCCWAYHFLDLEFWKGTHFDWAQPWHVEAVKKARGEL